MPSARVAAIHDPMAAGSKRHHQQRLEQPTVGDERVTLGVAGDPDFVEGMPDFRHLAQQRQPVEECAGLLLVAADDKRAPDPGAYQPRHEVAQVAAVPNHARRKVRHRPEPCGLELLAERNGFFDALRR